MSVLQNCDLEFSLQLLQIPEGDWKSWTPTCLLLGIHSSLEPMPRCTSGLRQGILIIFKFIIVQKPDLSISPVRPGYRHIKFDYTENTANISTKFWIFLFTLVQKMQRHFPLRECLNLILREAEDMEKKSGLCTLWLLSIGSRATFWLGQQWPQPLHPPLENNHHASNHLTILHIVSISNLEGWARPALLRFPAQGISSGCYSNTEA